MWVQFLALNFGIYFLSTNNFLSVIVDFTAPSIALFPPHRASLRKTKTAVAR